MQRYSPDINAPSGEEGDDTLLGCDEWSAPENIKPGLVQSAVNCDFTSGDAVTRGGFVCLPELGNAPFPATLTWTTRTTASDISWTTVAYGNGVFVAVASAGGVTNCVMTSPDGITWTLRAAIEGQWNGLAYGNGVFVAVGVSGTAGYVMTSPNGIAWTSRTAAQFNTWQAVTYGGSLFVAVASDGVNRVMTSPDGVTWTVRDAASEHQWTAVAYGNGLFVAANDNATTTPFMYSSDGITWTTGSVSDPGLMNKSFTGITFGVGTFVVVASGGEVATSPDGATWTAQTAPEANAWRSVVYGNNLFVAVASSGTNRVMISGRGSSWASVAASVANGWKSVTFGNNVYVAVSNTGTGDRAMTAGEVINTYASGMYSDPTDLGSQWIMQVGASKVGFYAFGRTSRTVNYAAGLTVSEQSTVVQCNNLVYIFRGPDATPLRWSGNWADEFQLATGSIQPATQALYYQNRLWEIVGKDGYYASDVLDFTAFTEITNQFNLSTGDSNFLVTSYPFGNSTILLFKNRSIMALSGVDGSLTDVVASEITRQVGAIGINAVVSVGPDVVYMSDRNINLITLTSTNNSLQHKTLPLSRNIQKIFNRVNWEYGYKVSMGFYDNKLFVALPLDNSTTCNSVVVYNFVTENWFGEWNFDSSLGIAIQNFVIANYLGLQRLHAITEDGRIFVVGEGPLDVSGTTFAEISSSVTTRAYSFGNQNHIPRRMYIDIATWRPEFSVTAYSNGVSESTEEVTDQTYLRSESWIFSDSTYTMTNVNDDYNRAGRKDYAGYPGDSIQCQSGFLPEAEQEIRFPIMTRRKGRLSWLKVDNTQGLLRLMSVGFEARPGDRGNYIQTI